MRVWLWLWLALVAILTVPAIARAVKRLRRRDHVIDSLIRPPVDRGFGGHDEAQEAAARQRRQRAEALAKDAARARLPRRLVFLEEERGNVRGFNRG
jgi:hypothetical protein